MKQVKSDKTMERVEEKYFKFQRTDWNGTNRKTIINSTMGLPKPAGVVFFKENLYVGDQNYKTVFKIPKDGAPRNQWQKLGSDLENVMDLVVYDKSVQPLSPGIFIMAIFGFLAKNILYFKATLSRAYVSQEIEPVPV